MKKFIVMTKRIVYDVVEVNARTEAHAITQAHLGRGQVILNGGTLVYLGSKHSVASPSLDNSKIIKWVKQQQISTLDMMENVSPNKTPDQKTTRKKTRRNSLQQ